MPTYADATAACRAASDAPFDLAAYAGAAGDYVYLRAWVLDEVTARYGVRADDFGSTASLYASTILTDFVHRAMQQVPKSAPVIGAGAVLTDIAAALRARGTGLCGVTAGQLWQVFRAFGWGCRLIDSINGPVDAYSGSHVVTEVDTLDGPVMQDALFNYTPINCDGGAIGWHANRAMTMRGAFTFDARQCFYHFKDEGIGAEAPNAHDLEMLAGPLWRVPWRVTEAAGAKSTQTYVATALFPAWQQARRPESSQGGTFASAAAARDVVRGLAAFGLDWPQIAYWLRGSGKYCCGILSADAAWVSVRLLDGGYLTLGLDDAGDFAGSLDEAWVAGRIPSNVVIVMPSGAIQSGLADHLTAEPLRDTAQVDSARKALSLFAA